MRRMLLCLAVCLGLAPAATAQEARFLYSADLAKTDEVPGLVGVTVDVYWCAGDEEANQRSVTASEIGGAAAAFARFSDPVVTGRKEGQFVRSVRVRPISLDGLSSMPAGAAGRDVMFTPKNDASRALADTIVKYSGQPLAVQTHSSEDISGIAIYLCRSTHTDDNWKRVYLQVATPEQVPSADLIVPGLRSSINGAKIAAGIEVMRGKSPRQTEVRYFWEGDRQFAEQVSAVVSKTIFDDPSTKFVAGYSQESNRGLVEVWLGGEFRPAQTTSSFVCIGDSAVNCPRSSEWVACGRNLQEWAAQSRTCISASFTSVASTGGGQCGYEVYRLNCTTAGAP